MGISECKSENSGLVRSIACFYPPIYMRQLLSFARYWNPNFLGEGWIDTLKGFSPGHYLGNRKTTSKPD